MSAAPTDERIARAIRALLAGRAPDRSLCPSEVARRLDATGERWRGLMPRVRAVARRLAAAGSVRITRGGDLLDPHAPLRGPVRLRRGPRFDAAG